MATLGEVIRGTKPSTTVQPRASSPGLGARARKLVDTRRHRCEALAAPGPRLALHAESSRSRHAGLHPGRRRDRPLGCRRRPPRRRQPASTAGKSAATWRQRPRSAAAARARRRYAAVVEGASPRHQLGCRTEQYPDGLAGGSVFRPRHRSPKPGNAGRDPAVRRARPVGSSAASGASGRTSTG